MLYMHGVRTSVSTRRVLMVQNWNRENWLGHKLLRRIFSETDLWHVPGQTARWECRFPSWRLCNCLETRLMLWLCVSNHYRWRRPPRRSADDLGSGRACGMDASRRNWVCYLPAGVGSGPTLSRFPTRLVAWDQLRAVQNIARFAKLSTSKKLEIIERFGNIPKFWKRVNRDPAYCIGPRNVRNGIYSSASNLLEIVFIFSCYRICVDKVSYIRT